MKRRSFIKYSSLFSTPLILGGIPVTSIARNGLVNLVNEDSDKVLVLIQLNGGNDGLDTLFPLNSYDVLANVRSNIIVPQNKLLKLGNNLAIHPSMPGIKSLYDDAQLNIIQSVGYPQQNRSHFRSSDIWHSGSATNEFSTNGWLGRYLDSNYEDYPAAYPNADYLDPFAVTIGSSVSETCQGISGNFSMAIVDPENITQLTSPLSNETATGCGAEQLDFLSNAIEKSNKYGARMEEAYKLGNNLGNLYGDSSRLAIQLKTVARLISGGLQSKIYVVNLGGFDTHADQTDEGDSTSGRHATLLEQLSIAITAFQDDLQQLGIDDRVLGMTYSEFGRRIQSNFSLGTDHGDAAPLIVFGSCVNAGIIGENPEISADVGPSDGVPMQIDFRSIYGSILIDWFEVEEEDAQNLFSEEFQYIPIASQCDLPSSIFENNQANFQINTFPNPTRGHTQIQFSTKSDWIKVSLTNNLGQEVKVISNRRFNEGDHTLDLDMSSVPSGSYFVKIQTSTLRKSVSLVKV